MVNKKKSVIGIVFITSIFFVMLISMISAVGVATGYSADTPLELYPGEERVVLLTLQNTDTEGTVSVEGTILEGSEIASLDKSMFEVAYKSIETSARLTVKAPEDAAIGQTYAIKYEFNPVPPEGDVTGTGASVSQGVTRNFDVLVVEKPVEPETPAEAISPIWYVLGIIVIIIVIALIWFGVKSKKDEAAMPVKPAKK